MNDTYENMENRLKEFVMKRLNEAKLHPEDVNLFQHMAIGAVLFSLNFLFPFYNDDLMNWWNNEIYPQFRELKA